MKLLFFAQVAAVPLEGHITNQQSIPIVSCKNVSIRHVAIISK